MTLNFKGIGIVLVMSLIGVAQAQELSHSEIKHLTISKVVTKEIPQHFPSLSIDVLPSSSLIEDPVEESPEPDKAGKVIALAKDLVALGEDIYKLVIKGKPTNTTTYAPISVIPRVNGQPVDLLDTEFWSHPVKKTYEVSYSNPYGIVVASFRYSVLYSYNGSYNDKGSYLTGVQIIPESVRTVFGFDFTATMKLGGIQNQGTKLNPIAAATLLIEHSLSSLVVSHTRVDTFFVTGRGELKKL
jgi:hypothetical protein